MKLWLLLGGAIMEDDAGLIEVLDDIVLMKFVGIKVILIHGGLNK